jgi:hypothetical protein
VTVPGGGFDGAAIANPNALTGTAWTRGRKNYDWHVETLAGSVMDTVDITDNFTAFAGLRLDRLLDFTAITFNATTAAATGTYHYKETLHNGWAGLSYRLTPYGIVYASFGSQIYHWPEIFAKLRRLNVHLVLSVGELCNEIEPGENCQIYRYAPQRTLLEHADVFVTHGGANSFMEAIAAGVPMLLSPMCNDQFHQAYFAERSGIGLVTDLRTIGDAELAAAVDTLLANGPHRAAIRKLAQSYAINGAIRAAELIERLRV